MLAYGGAADGALLFGPGEPPTDEESAPESHYGLARWVLTEDGRQLVQRVRSARELDQRGHETLQFRDQTRDDACVNWEVGLGGSV